ncbi:MAG: transglycosylase domain-containing protein [Arachnia sp.]
MAKAKASRAAKPLWRTILGRIGIGALVTFIVVGLLGLGGFGYLYATTDLPDPNEDFTTDTTFIYYGDGQTKLGSLSVQNRETLDYEQMPQVVKDAVVAAENRSFWEDPGISFSGILRSLVSIATGGEMQGGSTITQQYIKIYYLDSSQTIQRKVRELILAIKMSREVSKEDILEGYLNTIYFGRGAYGIEAASKSYFLKPASELTVSQAAALSAILNNPTAFNPSSGPEHLEALRGRYNYVLDGMLEMGAITQADYDAAYDTLPEFPEVPLNERYGGPKGFLMNMVENELLDLGFDEAEINGGGLEVVTTFDPKLQQAAVDSAQKYTAQAAADADEPQDPAALHVAISSVDTSTGAVLALYGGPDFVENSRNWSTTPRPTASTFKTFAAVAGLRNGYSLNSVLDGNTFTPRGDSQTIRNEFSYQYGPVTLRKAIADSINTAFVDMTQEMDNGAGEVAKAAADAGAPRRDDWNLNNRIALGAAEVSPLNMANAYATLADSGQYKPTYVVSQVKDRDGTLVYEAEPEISQTVDSNVAANVTDALTSVVSEGTGTKASALDRPVAGKTGTHGVEDEIQSAWFVGYTKQISTAVMYVVGDDGIGDLDPYRRPQDPTFFGSSYPLMTWLDYMQVAMEGLPVEDFDKAEPITPSPGIATLTPTPSPKASPTMQSPSATPSVAEPTAEPVSSATVDPPPATQQPTLGPTEEPTADPTPSVEPPAATTPDQATPIGGSSGAPGGPEPDPDPDQGNGNGGVGADGVDGGD